MVNKLERKLYLRLVRSACAAVFAFLLLIIVSAQVMAETEPEAAIPENAELAETAQALPEESFGAITAQLEAVARAEGRTIASQMLYESLREISAVSAPIAEMEDPAVQTAVSDRAPAVVVNMEKKNTWSVSGVLPFILVAVIAVGAMLAVFAAMRRQSGYRNVSRAYRPVRRRVLQEDTFSKGRVLRLDR